MGVGGGGGWKAHCINNTWVMGIRATFHTIMHYNSQLQLSGWRVLTQTAFQPPNPYIFFWNSPNHFSFGKLNGVK